MTHSSFDLCLHLDHIVGYEPMAHGVNGMEKKRRDFGELGRCSTKDSDQITLFSYGPEENLGSNK